MSQAHHTVAIVQPTVSLPDMHHHNLQFYLLKSKNSYAMTYQNIVAN